MADLLNTLTIDGTSMDIWNDRLPKSTIPTSSSTFNLSTATDVTRNLFTVQDTGILLCVVHVNFGANEAGSRIAGITINNVNAGSMIVRAAVGGQTQLIIPKIRSVSEGAQIGVYVRQTSGATLKITTRADHILIPDKVGGVIRNLKNLVSPIGCHPFNFRRAVA